MTVVRMKTDATARKVYGATAGAGVAGSAATILIWIIQDPSMMNVPLPDHIAAAITTLVTTAATFFAGYYTRPGAGDEVTTEPAATPPLSPPIIGG